MILKIFKMIATSFRVHQIRLRSGLRPGLCWGSLQRSDPRSPTWFKGPTSKGKEVREWGKGRGRAEEGKGGIGPPYANSRSAPGS